MKDISPLAGNPLLAILEVSAALVSSTVFRDALEAVVGRIGEATSVSSCDLHTYDAPRNLLIYEGYWSIDGVTDEDRAYIGTVTPVDDRPDLQAILDSDGLVEQHVDDPRISAHDVEQLRKWGYRSTLDMPLRVGDRVIGILGLQEKRFVRRFTPAERDQFLRLCELAALGIHSAGLLRRDQERGRHLGSLGAISHALATVREPGEVFSAIADAAARSLGAPRVIVYDYDVAAETLTPRAIHQDEYDADYASAGVSEAIARARGDDAWQTHPEPRLEQASDPDLDPEVGESLARWGETTRLQATMVCRGKPRGMLVAAWTGHERLVTADELALSKAIGEQAAVALDNVRLRSVEDGWRSRLEGSPE